MGTKKGFFAGVLVTALAGCAAAVAYKLYKRKLENDFCSCGHICDDQEFSAEDIGDSAYDCACGCDCECEGDCDCECDCECDCDCECNDDSDEKNENDGAQESCSCCTTDDDMEEPEDVTEADESAANSEE